MCNVHALSTFKLHDTISLQKSAITNFSTYHRRYRAEYVCPKIYIRRALNKVTDAPRSQTNKNVFNARLKCSVDKSTERKEVGRLVQILAAATAKLRSRNALLVRGTTNVAVSDDRRVRRLESAMS